jgi:hypothetical protein
MKSKKKSQQTTDHGNVNVEIVPREPEMPPPPNEAPVEWAIQRIESSLRSTENEPDWSDKDIARFAPAARLCTDPEEAIRRGLKRQFLNTCGRLAASIHLNNCSEGWTTFGERLRRISPIFDVTLTVERAIEFIETRLFPFAHNFSPEDARLIEQAREVVVRFGNEIPQTLRMRFRDTMRLVERVVRESYADSHWIAVGRSLQLPIPSPQWALDVLTATALMADLPNPEPNPHWFTERRFQIQHVSRVMKQYRFVQRPGPYYLPFGYLSILNRAAFHLAEAIVEKPSPHLLQLQRTLRIGKCYDGGYRYGRTQVREGCSNDHPESVHPVPIHAEAFDEVSDDLDVTCLESSILKMGDTVRKHERPAWSRQDFDTLLTARELCPQLDERIHRDLMHRFRSALTDFVCCVIRRVDEVEWASFSAELLRVAPNDTEVTLLVGAATRLTQRMINTRDTKWWGEEEIKSLFRAVALVDRVPAAMPGLVSADFHLCWKIFAKFIRRKHAESAVRSFVAALRRGITDNSPNSAFIASLP